MKNPLFFLFLSRWAGNKAWQKMRRGWWLVRWLGTGMAILSLLTHSWGQDTEGMSSQRRGEHPQASPSSVNCSCTAKRKLVMWKGNVSFHCQRTSMVVKPLYNSITILLLINEVPNWGVDRFNSLLLNGLEVKTYFEIFEHDFPPRRSSLAKYGYTFCIYSYSYFRTVVYYITLTIFYIVGL